MDETKAKETAERLLTKRIGKWKIVESELMYGKSAVVLRGIFDGESAAVKVFDRALSEKHGGIDDQLTRIERQLDLRQYPHSNIIEVLEGGLCTNTGELYLAMQWLDYFTIDECLDKIPRAQIWNLLCQLSTAAKHLESLNIVHRDIKPSNIAISEDFKHLVLLDLGVIRPLDISDLTDDDQPQFLGTLRYSSPEYLYRQEESTPEGWRALTFYQIGAVLHDLLMRVQLFAYAHPYARLVTAVKEDIPEINAVDASEELCILARNCLIKDPVTRISAISWDSFRKKVHSTEVEAARARIHDRQVSATHTTSVESSRINISPQENERILNEIDRTIRLAAVGELFPRFSVYGEPVERPDPAYIFTLKFRSDPHKKLAGDLSIGVRVIIDSQNPITIQLACSAEYNCSPLIPSGVDPSYTGVFDEATVQALLQNYFVVSLDAAQSSNG